jgi:ATP synthase protein I
VKGSPDGSRFTAWALVGQLALTMVASIVFGIVLGLWVDGLVGTRPLFTLLLSLLGISAASLAGYRAVAAAYAQYDHERAATKRPARQDDQSSDTVDEDDSQGETH